MLQRCRESEFPPTECNVRGSRPGGRSYRRGISLILKNPPLIDKCINRAICVIRDNPRFRQKEGGRDREFPSYRKGVPLPRYKQYPTPNPHNIYCSQPNNPLPIHPTPRYNKKQKLQNREPP